MKNLKLLIGITMALLFIVACSSDDDSDSSQLSFEELLTQNSPWTFNHYEMATIIDAGNSNITQEDIENDVDQANNSVIVTFNDDGTGTTFSPQEGTDPWEWEIVSTNNIIITFEGGSTETLENFSVSSTQFTFKGETVTFDPITVFEVLHSGTYFYD